jgi:hypothetical protein
MESTYPSSLSLEKHIRRKHVRSANWVAPTCPQGRFLFFEGVSQLGGANLSPRDVFLSFWRGWGLDFPSSSQIVPIKFLLFPSKSFCSHQVPKKFPSNSSCSHQVPIKFLLFSSSSHQIPLVPINNPSISFCSHQVPKQFHQISLVPIATLFYLLCVYHLDYDM